MITLIIRCSFIHGLILTTFVFVLRCTDIGADTIYWTEAETGKVQRANLDDLTVEDVVTGLNGPGVLDIDPVCRKVYWGSFDHKIERADLDGKNRQDVLTINDSLISENG